MTACANLVAACETPVLQPGFRLTRDTDGADLWLPSLTPEQAQQSAEVVLSSIKAEALPYFESLRTPQGFLAQLATERWGSSHHLSFQRGVSAAMSGDATAARRHLSDAIALYEADGRDWCSGSIAKAEHLLTAVDAGAPQPLLDDWYKANCKAHGLG